MEKGATIVQIWKKMLTNLTEKKNQFGEGDKFETVSPGWI